MKSFFKQVFASFLGNLFFYGIFFGIIIFFLLISIVSNFMNKESLKDNSVFELQLNNKIIENPNEQQSEFLSFNKSKPITYYEILDMIASAKNDDKIKGISLKVDDISADWTQITEIKKAIQDFKTSKKFVYAYGNVMSQKSYYLSTVADSIFLNPNGGIQLTGISTDILFFKNFGEKYGVDFQVIRHGDYKGAVEPFIRDNLSEENRSQLTSVLGNIWQQVSGDMAQARKININRFNQIADSLNAFISNMAINDKIVDKLIYEDQYNEKIRKKLGLKDQKELDKHTTYIGTYINEYMPKYNGDEQIAIINASGTIIRGEYDGSNISPETYISMINDIKEDESIKAVLLRINSPGGDAIASDDIYHALMELKKVKPLYISFGGVAASGGYYMAMAGDKIYSEPATITGSIGVLGMVPSVKKLANNVGITADFVETNANSNYYSLMSGLTPGGMNMMTKKVEIIYKKFIGVVMNNRKKTFAQIDSLGGGRIYTGQQAKELGLVDEIGGLNEAIAGLAKKANLKDITIVSYPKAKEPFEQFMGSLNFKTSTDDLIKSKIGNENFLLYQQLVENKRNSKALYLMPYTLDIH